MTVLDRKASVKIAVNFPGNVGRAVSELPDVNEFFAKWSKHED